MDRYRPNFFSEEMEVEPNGDYVLHSDYAALLEEKTKALDGTGHATLAEMRREFDAMRAEVAAWRKWKSEYHAAVTPRSASTADGRRSPMPKNHTIAAWICPHCNRSHPVTVRSCECAMNATSSPPMQYPIVPFSPCMHDNCPECHGTGVKKSGGSCIHCISCPCPKCSPTCGVTTNA